MTSVGIKGAYKMVQVSQRQRQPPQQIPKSLIFLSEGELEDVYLDRSPETGS